MVDMRLNFLINLQLQANALALISVPSHLWTGLFPPNQSEKKLKATLFIDTEKESM